MDATTIVTVQWAHRSNADPAWLAVLDPAERARYGSYRRAADRERFLVGAALVRAAASRATGLPPARVPVDRRCADCGEPHGAPRIADGAGDLRLSVAHSGDAVAVALATGTAIGLDVERIPDAATTRRLSGAALGAGEVVHSAAEFATVWTRKEAVLKCTGAGLRVAPRDVVVSAARRPPTLLAYPGRADLPHLISLVDVLGAPRGYRATVAVHDRQVPILVEQPAHALLAGALGPRREPHPLHGRPAA